MKVALNEKRKKLCGFSFSINIANFEAFFLVFKLTKNLNLAKMRGKALFNLAENKFCANFKWLPKNQTSGTTGSVSSFYNIPSRSDQQIFCQSCIANSNCWFLGVLNWLVWTESLKILVSGKKIFWKFIHNKVWLMKKSFVTQTFFKRVLLNYREFSIQPQPGTDKRPIWVYHFFRKKQILPGSIHPLPKHSI